LQRWGRLGINGQMVEEYGFCFCLDF